MIYTDEYRYERALEIKFIQDSKRGQFYVVETFAHVKSYTWWDVQRKGVKNDTLTARCV